MTSVGGEVFIQATFSLGMEPFTPGIIFLLGAAVGKSVGNVILSLGRLGDYQTGKEEANATAGGKGYSERGIYGTKTGWSG